jgi:hypothetical protein
VTVPTRAYFNRAGGYGLPATRVTAAPGGVTAAQTAGVNAGLAAILAKADDAHARYLDSVGDTPTKPTAAERSGADRSPLDRHARHMKLLAPHDR